MKSYVLKSGLVATDFELDNCGDYPDFCDASIVRATVDMRDATDAELDELNENSDFVHECVIDFIY